MSDHVPLLFSHPVASQYPFFIVSSMPSTLGPQGLCTCSFCLPLSSPWHHIHAQSLLTCHFLSEDFTWPLFKFSIAPKRALRSSFLLYISQHLHSYNIYFTCLFLFTSKNISSNRARGSVCCVYCRITST